MKKKAYRRRFPAAAAAALLLFALIAILLLYGLRSARAGVSAESLRLAEDSVRRAAVVCYSIESRYPDSYEYLAENYGVSVDLERFAVHYEIFASNLMPEITVVRR